MTLKYHNSKFDRDIAEKAIKKAIREKLAFDRGGEQNDAFTADNIPTFDRSSNRFGRKPAPDMNESRDNYFINKRVGRVKRLINATGDVLGIKAPRSFERDAGKTRLKNLADTLGHTALQVSMGAIGGAATGLGAPVGAAMGAAAGIGFPVRERYKFLKSIGEENTTLQALTEARKVSDAAARAFLNKTPKRASKDLWTDGKYLYNYGSVIASHEPNGKISASLVRASLTTKRHLNALTKLTHGKEMFYTKKGRHYFGKDPITERDVVEFPADSRGSMNEELQLDEAKIIVTKRNKDGSYDEVGMNNRSIFNGSPNTIKKRAKEWAKGPHRIEWLNSSNPYKEPTKIEHLDEAKDTKHVSMTPMHSIIKHYGPGEGRHWFDTDTMRFFKSRIADYAYTGKYDGNHSYFVTSEKGPSGVRKYSVRHYNWETRDIKTIGDFNSHSKSSAHSLARSLASNDSKEALKNKKPITEQQGSGSGSWSNERFKNQVSNLKKKANRERKLQKIEGKLRRKSERAEAFQGLKDRIHNWLVGKKKSNQEIAGTIHTLPGQNQPAIAGPTSAGPSKKKLTASQAARIANLHGQAQRIGPHTGDKETRAKYNAIHDKIKQIQNEEALNEQMLEEGRGGFNKVLSRAGKKHGFTVKPGFYHAKYGYTNCHERTKEWHMDKLNRYLGDRRSSTGANEIYHNYVRLKNSKFSKAVKSLPSDIQSYLRYMRKAPPAQEGRDAFYKKQTRKRKNAIPTTSVMESNK